MGKNQFQYDETGNTYYYVFLTFLGLILLPGTSYFWQSDGKGLDDPEKRKKFASAAAKDTPYYHACVEKASRIGQRDPWSRTRRRLAGALLLFGWAVFAFVIYRLSQFDYEMANFDPHEILEVGFDASIKEIKKKYRELSLKYHPDKPTGDEKLFMKLTKAYDALTDETAKYNWEHYGNPDGPQAMEFGIGLPAWIVEEKNSIWVLGLYTLVFMIGLPTAVYYWWSNSSKFSGEQVLMDTSQLYFHFFHKTPHMMLKRALTVLAASWEFERSHNSEITERPTDNVEIPQLMKSIPNLGVNNKEKPLCFPYSVKARALLFAHLSRMYLPQDTLHQDRMYMVKKGPFLVHEMVSCISQLILLAYAGRIGRQPSLDTIEYTMKLSPMIVQALWDKQSPLLQLPHVEEDMMKHFHTKRKNIKSLQQLAQMKDEERRSLLCTLSDDQYKDVIRVLSAMPVLSISVTTEVVDDEDQHVVTAGAIITVTLALERKTLDSVMTNTHVLSESAYDNDDEKEGDERDDVDGDGSEHPAAALEDGGAVANEKEDKKKTPVWRKPEKKKKAGNKPGGGGKQKQKAKAKPTAAAALKAPEAAAGVGGDQAATLQDKASESSSKAANGQVVPKHKRKTDDGSGSDEGEDNNSGGSDSESDSGDKADPAAAVTSSHSAVEEVEDDEAEWDKFQKKINKREKVLEGKSRISHSVHCPHFTDDKQEFWWAYIADRKNHALVTPPNHVTSLVEREEVELKFTAPQKPGRYNFTVCLRSDSYLGMDYMEDIKLEVQEARDAPTEHPQWEFEDDDEDEGSKDEDSDNDYATDDDFDEEEEEEEQ